MSDTLTAAQRAEKLEYPVMFTTGAENSKYVQEQIERRSRKVRRIAAAIRAAEIAAEKRTWDEAAKIVCGPWKDGYDALAMEFAARAAELAKEPPPELGGA